MCGACPERPISRCQKGRLRSLCIGASGIRTPVLQSHEASTNVEFWNEKFETNGQRDTKRLRQLKDLDWRTVIVWECAFKPRLHDKLIKELGEFIRGEGGYHIEFSGKR
jgi:G:T-mismatch repair DNA endonuclease (very short patch repair protein)